MDKLLFDDLVCSLKEAQAILRGEIKASRRFTVELIVAEVVRENLVLVDDL